jgi:hypothetical protein
MGRSKTPLQYLLREFIGWLINEKIEQRRQMNKRGARAQMVNSPARIKWIEKLLQTPIDNYRKLAVWRILVQYLINIRQLSDDETNEMICNWLDKCRTL